MEILVPFTLDEGQRGGVHMRLSKISNSRGVASGSNGGNGASVTRRWAAEALTTSGIIVCVVLVYFLCASICSNGGVTLLAMRSFSRAFGQ